VAAVPKRIVKSDNKTCAHERGEIAVHMGITGILTMRMILVSILVLAFLSPVAGCGGMHAARETTRMADENPSHFFNTVMLVWGSRGVISTGRLGGEETVRIRDVDPIAKHEWRNGGVMRLLDASGFPSVEEPTWFRESAEDSIAILAGVLEVVLQELSAFDDVAINLDIVVARADSGALYQNRSAIGRSMTISIIHPLPEYDEEIHELAHKHTWWSRSLKSAAHELYHLHHSLSDLVSTSINEEAAASIFGDCTLLRYSEAIEAYPMLDYTWLLESPKTQRSFPLLDQGDFAPDEAAFQEEFPEAGLRGRILGSAAFFALAGDGVLEIDDDAERARVLEYCDGLARGVPDFYSGDLLRDP